MDFLVDRNIYRSRAATSLVQKHSQLRRAVTLDLRHHYSGPIQALYWISLCRDRAYGHLDLVRSLHGAFPDALGELRRRSSAERPQTLVSLGPGDGGADIRILSHLEKQTALRSYVCVDSSFGLLSYAVNQVLQSRRLKTRFPIRAVYGDFTSLDPASLGEASARPRLFAVTGLTLGNYVESRLLRQIAGLMTGGEFLFVDARLHSLDGWNGRRMLTEKEASSVLRNYSHEGCNRFVFGPVETVTTATAQDVEFGYEPCRRVTTVPNALNVVIYCRNLRTRMRVTGRPVRRKRLDLASTTLYSFERLRDWLPQQGFDPVWSRKAGPYGFFLLRRR